jgi:hypothetical protein
MRQLLHCRSKTVVVRGHCLDLRNQLPGPCVFADRVLDEIALAQGPAGRRIEDFFFDLRMHIEDLADAPPYRIALRQIHAIEFVEQQRDDPMVSAQ